MKHLVIGLTTAFIILLNSVSAKAITLEEYGIEITSTGFVDTTTGLRWLDSDLTLGTNATIDSLIDDGWRIASVFQLVNLFYRGNGPDPSGPDNPLSLTDFLILTDALGLTRDGTFNHNDNPWACMRSGPVCQNTNLASFTPVLFTAEEAFPGSGLPGVETYIGIYLPEKPLYGDILGHPCDSCIGRTLLVRNVPIPAGLWLLLSALGAVGLRQVVTQN